MPPTYSGDIFRVLQANFLFRGLSPEHVAILVEKVSVQQIAAGDLIVREGEQADTLYLVVSGGVNVTRGDGQFLAFLGPSGFFGEMALFLESSRRSATCKAATDTTCILIHKEVLEKFCTENPQAGLTIYQSIIRTLAERLQATSGDLALLMKSKIMDQKDVNELIDHVRRTKATKSSDDDG